MLIADFDSNNVVGFTQPKEGLLETHRSKISLHRAKAGYDYPTIRLPHTFSRLVGLSSLIYQTIHEGALAFLVVISPTENAAESPKASVFTRRRSPVRIRPSPLFSFLFWLKLSLEKRSDFNSLISDSKAQRR